MSFKRHFLRGESEAILNGLEPALGLGMLGVGLRGRVDKSLVVDGYCMEN